MTPRYQHDCSKCIFQGRDGEHDVYWCPGELLSRGEGGSVIARFSSDGPDYASGPVFQYLTSTIREHEAPPEYYHFALVRAAKKLLRNGSVALVTINPLPQET